MPASTSQDLVTWSDAWWPLEERQTLYVVASVGDPALVRQYENWTRQYENWLDETQRKTSKTMKKPEAEALSPLQSLLIG